MLIFTTTIWCHGTILSRMPSIKWQKRTVKIFWKELIKFSTLWCNKNRWCEAFITRSTTTSTYTTSTYRHSFATASSTTLTTIILFLNRHKWSSTACGSATIYFCRLYQRYYWCRTGHINTENNLRERFCEQYRSNCRFKYVEKIYSTETWMVCTTNKLNTTMRNAIENHYQDHAIVIHEITVVESMVGMFKQSGIYNKKPIESGYSGCRDEIWNFVSCWQALIESANEVLGIIEEEENHTGSVHFKSLHQFEIEGCKPSFSALSAIINCFHPIRKMQKVMETSNRPFLHHLLPQIESLKAKLHFVPNGIAQGSQPVFPDEITRSLEA